MLKEYIEFEEHYVRYLYQFMMDVKKRMNETEESLIEQGMDLYNYSELYLESVYEYERFVESELHQLETNGRNDKMTEEDFQKLLQSCRYRKDKINSLVNHTEFYFAEGSEFG